MSRYWTAHSDLDWYGEGDQYGNAKRDYCGDCLFDGVTCRYPECLDDDDPTPAQEEAAMAEIEAEREADRRRAVLQEAAEWLRFEGESFLADKLLQDLAP